jgi:phosphopentomutase
MDSAESREQRGSEFRTLNSELLSPISHLPSPIYQFIWVNLVDFDQDFGHRLDPVGFAKALEAFDAFLPKLMASMPKNSRLCITADHGNDPCGTSTDHSREFVPLLCYPPKEQQGKNLGTLLHFKHHHDLVLSYFATNHL